MWQAIRGSCELWPASALPRSNPPPPHLAQPWPLPSSQLQEKKFQPSPIPIIPSHGHFPHLNCCSERWGWTVSKLVNLFFMDWIQEYLFPLVTQCYSATFPLPFQVQQFHKSPPFFQPDIQGTIGLYCWVNWWAVAAFCKLINTYNLCWLSSRNIHTLHSISIKGYWMNNGDHHGRFKWTKILSKLPKSSIWWIIFESV